MKYIMLTLLLTGCVTFVPIPTAHAIEPDKEKHLMVGIALGTFDWKLGCGAGLAKEGFDKVYGGTVEFADFAYTCGGAGLTSVIGRDKSWLYKADVSLILLDGLSTSHAIHNGAREVGWLASRTIGPYPSDRDIAVYTVANLILLDWSESWNPYLKNAFQWTILITRPYIIRINFSF